MNTKVKKKKQTFFFAVVQPKKEEKRKNSGKTDVSFYLAFVCLQLAMCAYDITYFWMFFFRCFGYVLLQKYKQAVVKIASELQTMSIFHESTRNTIKASTATYALPKTAIFFLKQDNSRNQNYYFE